MEADTNARRLTVNVAADVGDAIEEMAQQQGITIADLIRRAVSTYRFVRDEVGQGHKILVEQDRSVREVTFL
jgi:hypothetical protein